ncbi:YceD family protein [Moraxella caviae]|nr:YceD family protein [Moraxella caviae]
MTTTNKPQDSMTASKNQPASNQPANIVLEKWADIGFDWAGKVSVDELPRLAAQVSRDGVLDVSVSLAKKNGILWLNFAVAGVLKLPCQRCLEPMAVDVSGEYQLAILADEKDSALVDGAEFVLVDELNPHDGRKMLPLLDLLEDELLLALPLAPRHDDCEMLTDSVGDAPEEQPENPFAALAALKGRLN